MLIENKIHKICNFLSPLIKSKSLSGWAFKASTFFQTIFFNPTVNSRYFFRSLSNIARSFRNPIKAFASSKYIILQIYSTRSSRIRKHFQTVANIRNKFDPKSRKASNLFKNYDIRNLHIFVKYLGESLFFRELRQVFWNMYELLYFI